MSRLHSLTRNMHRAAADCALTGYVPGRYPYSIPVYGGVHSTGFTKGPATGSSQQVLSYHIYTCGFADSGCDTNGDFVSLHTVFATAV